MTIGLLQKTGAWEVYNLSAQSFVAASLDQPITTGKITVARRAAPVRGDPLLPGVHLRDVRQGPGDPADRADALLPAQPLRGGEALRALISPVAKPGYNSYRFGITPVRGTPCV